MKKELCVIISMFLFCSCLCGQYKSITVPAGTKIIDNFPPSVRYMYPQFVEGQLILNNGLFSGCLINYNMLRDEMEIIQDNNDTLTILKKRELQYIIVDNDTFIYTQGGYAKHIYGQKLKIYCRDKLYLKEVLTRGAMGTINRTSFIPVNDTRDQKFNYTNYRNLNYDIILLEDMVFKREVLYYIASSNGALEPFKQKNVLKLFSHHKSDVQKYLKNNNVNFEKQEDVIKLAEYLSTL